MKTAQGREAEMADPVFLARVLAAALVAFVLSLGAFNGWGEPASSERGGSHASAGR